MGPNESAMNLRVETLKVRVLGAREVFRASPVLWA